MPYAYKRPFRISPPDNSSLKSTAVRWSLPLVENVLAFRQMNLIYARMRRARSDKPFSDVILDVLGIDWEPDAAAWERIPRTGPLVVVANHPFGGIEGLILAAILQRVRPDVRIMANYLLGMLPELRENLIEVDPFGGSGSGRRNLAPMREAIAWVKSGGVLGVFPAGEVSHLSLKQRCVTDPEWSDSVARIVKRSGAAVLPIFFDGRNSKLFQSLGLVHPRLRTILLPRELLKRQHTRIDLEIGRVIPNKQLARHEDAEEMTAYLRLRTYLLKSQSPSGRPRELPPHHQIDPSEGIYEKIADAEPVDVLEAEIDALPASHLLTKSSDLCVYYASASQAPACLREIGRLREVTFRKVGEGTGKTADIDRFDADYTHLFIWNRAERHIVGAYRFARADQVLAHRGIDGLYTSTLFKIKPELLQQIGTALELGRSFVRLEYQKSYAPLMLLWKGIGQYLVRHPQYRALFGAVSISNDYHDMTKQLLVHFLRHNGYAGDLAKLVKAKNPMRKRRRLDLDRGLLAAVVHDLRDVDELVAEIEIDHKFMPVLLRQYLKLNGRLLGFNVDPDFGNVLDGLMLIELENVDRQTLKKYFGSQEAEDYLAWPAS